MRNKKAFGKKVKGDRRNQVIEKHINHIRIHNDEVEMGTQGKIGGKGGKKSKLGIYKTVTKKPDTL